MKTDLKTLQCTFAWLLLLSCIVPVVQAADLSAPVVLVATETLAGPYRETVLLAVPAGDGQHMGLIVNRPTTIDLASVVPDASATQPIKEPWFFGGPVMSGTLFAAIRTANPPSNYSVSLMPGLYLVTDEDTVDKLIKDTPNAARYFTGFVVWNQNELAEEIAQGMWEVQPADVNVLFRADPQKLWLDLAKNKGHVASN